METYLHSLAALGRDQLQSYCEPGAMSDGLRDLAVGATRTWMLTGLTDAGPDHLIVGLASDVFLGDYDRPLLSLLEIVEHYREVSPKTQVWAIGYPPLDRDQLTNPFLAAHVSPGRYEAFRQDYAEYAQDIGARVIARAHDGWQPSGLPHPLIPGGDYHLDEASALNAAMRIYYTIRTNQ